MSRPLCGMPKQSRARQSVGYSLASTSTLGVDAGSPAEGKPRPRSTKYSESLDSGILEHSCRATVLASCGSSF
eukprot:CAMPEP_0181405336 /NCGR_PEP_ID=MMETSP1110-20121109/4707_1 /TAXON_ID=174948 /ORGANISM="Symbiodinium sp., Strain CCMP421" /LENGTH=72 /DNA_ID=CAMNT_0023527721 /DNA_START=175 /DNA_END=390 /DNA_ORIENTATION=-